MSPQARYGKAAFANWTAFRDATDKVAAGVRLADIAAAAGVSPQTIRRARPRQWWSLERRNPPVNWRQIVASLARKRAAELVSLAKEIERQA